MSLRVVFPADLLRPARVDEHFGWRAEIAAAQGVATAVIGDPQSRNALRALEPGETAVIQGWMLSAEEYRAIAELVSTRGARLLTDTDRYTRAHHLPGWYDVFAAHTPETIVLPPDTSDPDLIAATVELGGTVVVKDWVKSRKHEWESACFVPEPAAAPAIVAELLRLAGPDLVGGIVLRRWEKLIGPESRVWWVGGEPAVITAHPDTPDQMPEVDLAGLAPLVAALDCPFVTTDLVRDIDGVQRVIEVGDGQVSDFPRTGDYARLLAALADLAHDH